MTLLLIVRTQRFIYVKADSLFYKFNEIDEKWCSEPYLCCCNDSLLWVLYSTHPSSMGMVYH